MPLYRCSVIDRGLRVERIRAAGGGDLPLGLRVLYLLGGLGSSPRPGDVPGDRRARRAQPTSASTLVPGVTLADQALIAAALGSGCWAASALLRRLQVAEAYRVPWFRAAAASMPGRRCSPRRRTLIVAGIDSAIGSGGVRC